MPDKADVIASPRLQQVLMERLAAQKSQIFWSGASMTVVGLLALLFPAFTTFTIEVVVGWLLVFAGAATIYGAFSVGGTGPFFSLLLLGLLKLALGVYLLMHPDDGMMALTLMLAILFMLDGAIQLGFALDLRPTDGWIWVLVSALVSIAAGLLIAAGLPATSIFAIGMLVGINFLSTGLANIMLSRLLPSPRTK